MRKHFIKAVAVIVSSVLSIGLMIAMTANAFASEGAKDNRDMIALTKTNRSLFFKEEPTEEPTDELDEPETECVDPMYLYFVVMYQPSVSQIETSEYSMSFLPDGSVYSLTLSDFGCSDAPYELMVNRCAWLDSADDWIGDKNGSNIAFYARTKGTITVYYDESTDEIRVEGTAVEMTQAHYKLHDTIYDPPQTTTAPAECTAPSTEPATVLKKGDVNNDGVVSIADVTEIQLALAEFTTLTAEQKIAADINNNGNVTINDATKIQMLLANLIPGLD